MNIEKLRELLIDIKDSKVSIDDALVEFKKMPFEDIGFAKIDHHRSIRNGYPEVIYCQGKTSKQVRTIIEKLIEKHVDIIATRVTKDMFNDIKDIEDNIIYYEEARIAAIKRNNNLVSDKIITIVSAGTSDIPVAEEASVTAELLGNKVNRIYDVGVAGIHRLFYNIDTILNSNVLIVVAGMEGALPSVVSGLVDKPVIAVPTSVGYGASFGGLSALLTMLNSCASGIGVVNIDNGFGAGYLASMINKL